MFLTWFGYELSLNVIAAILTITGYSVNDTIVVFDRVRENQRHHAAGAARSGRQPRVNQTLGRTIITAGMTFLAVDGAVSVRRRGAARLAFTLLVGIVTGTYSTVFIAAAIAIILQPPSGQRAAAPSTRPRRAGEGRKRRPSALGVTSAALPRCSASCRD